LVISLRQVKLYFMINGIVLLIGFGFGLLAFFFGGMLAAFG